MTDNSEVLVGKPSKSPSKAMTRMEDMLDVSGNGKGFEQEFKSTKRIGQIIILIVFGIFGLWSVLMPIDGAAHAPGQVTVKSFKKPVQHVEGGTVKEVRVHDGDRVKAGDVLVVMDDTLAKSQLGSLTTQLKSRLAQEARLIAERDGKDSVSYPAELLRTDPEAQQEIAAQNQVFKTRRTTLRAETQAYQQRVEQLQELVKGREAMRDNKANSVKMTEADIEDYKALIKEGFAEKSRMRDLERFFMQTKGEVADLDANIASTKLQIIEAKIQVGQLQNKAQTEIAAQLSETQTQMKDLQERVKALADAVERADVRAPDGGIVNNLKVHTAGTVIPAGVILAEIVPENDELIVEAKVSPMDIDRVAVGQLAKVNMSALNSRKVPNLKGAVISLSADAIAEPNGAGSYYLAKLELTPQSLKDLNGEVLVPGMPAEVFISTGSRTFFQFMMEPLSDSMARSLRED